MEKWMRTHSLAIYKDQSMARSQNLHGYSWQLIRLRLQIWVSISTNYSSKFLDAIIPIQHKPIPEICSSTVNWLQWFRSSGSSIKNSNVFLFCLHGGAKTANGNRRWPKINIYAWLKVNYHVITGQSTSLVKAADIDLSITPAQSTIWDRA
jgi:hypothetical protein